MKIHQKNEFQSLIHNSLLIENIYQHLKSIMNYPNAFISIFKPDNIIIPIKKMLKMLYNYNNSIKLFPYPILIPQFHP